MSNSFQIVGESEVVVCNLDTAEAHDEEDTTTSSDEISTLNKRQITLITK
jgi:hypothetical protein